MGWHKNNGPAASRGHHLIGLIGLMSKTALDSNCGIGCPRMVPPRNQTSDMVTGTLMK